MIDRNWFFLLVAFATACHGGANEKSELRALLNLPDHFELPAIPTFNPLSQEKIHLGRHLFYDRRLSANETQSCADCHLPERAFADSRNPVGSTGATLIRNSLGLTNVAFFSTYTWASNTLFFLEDQLEIPIVNDNPIELGVLDGVREEVFGRFERDPSYASMFADAFPESSNKVTLNKITFALASFSRTLVSGTSPYDDYLSGDKSALTDEQKLGLSLFGGERFECFHCHTGINFTVAYHDKNLGEPRQAFFNNGLYNVGGDGSYPAQDQGLHDLTLDPRHRGLFRPPSLRNVEFTAPYMHDGSIATLREVVEHYAAGGRNIESGPFAGDGRVSPRKSGLVRGFQATDEEIDAVVAFLKSLSDEKFLTNPAFSNPWSGDGQ